MLWLHQAHTSYCHIIYIFMGQLGINNFRFLSIFQRVYFLLSQCFVCQVNIKQNRRKKIHHFSKPNTNCYCSFNDILKSVKINIESNIHIHIAIGKISALMNACACFSDKKYWNHLVYIMYVLVFVVGRINWKHKLCSHDAKIKSRHKILGGANLNWLLPIFVFVCIIYFPLRLCPSCADACVGASSMSLLLISNSCLLNIVLSLLIAVRCRFAVF